MSKRLGLELTFRPRGRAETDDDDNRAEKWWGRKIRPEGPRSIFLPVIFLPDRFNLLSVSSASQPVNALVPGLHRARRMQTCGKLLLESLAT